jgi:hypothetical protein
VKVPLTESLIRFYGHDNATVRKPAVDCLVAFYLAFGESFKEALAPLTGMQMKLVKVFYEREQQRRQLAQAS